VNYRLHILVLSIFISGSGSAQVAAQIPAQALPEFNFFRADKSAFTNKDLPRGKGVFFVFFDPGCEHCQRAVATLGRQYAKFQNVTICLISTEDEQKINLFMATYGPRLRTRKNVIVLQDKLQQFIPRFKPYKYPAMFLYSAGNKLLDYEDNEDTMFRFERVLAGAGAIVLPS